MEHFEFKYDYKKTEMGFHDYMEILNGNLEDAMVLDPAFIEENYEISKWDAFKIWSIENLCEIVEGLTKTEAEFVVGMFKKTFDKIIQQQGGNKNMYGVRDREVNNISRIEENIIITDDATNEEIFEYLRDTIGYFLKDTKFEDVRFEWNDDFACEFYANETEMPLGRLELESK